MSDKLSHDLADENIPGVIVEVTPAEAERQGSFTEDAISLADVKDAAIDVEPDEENHHGE